MTDVLCFGEALIDFISRSPGCSLVESELFKKSPGGTPLNVAVGLSRLNVHSGFMGKVGQDPFGDFLEVTLQANRVNTRGLLFTNEAKTGLAFVSLGSGGERDFSFYRDPAADMLIHPDEISSELLKDLKIFHFGSISTISEPARSATEKAVQLARESGALISFDPNLRLNLWPDAESAREAILEFWNQAQIIKLSQEELFFLLNHSPRTISDPQELLEEAVERLWHDSLVLLVVTLDRDGCAAVWRDACFHLPGYKVQSIDTTGAGDGFMAGLLSQIIQKGLLTDPASSPKDLKGALDFGNITGALTTTRNGAVPALPTASEVQQFLLNHPRNRG